MQLYRRGDTGPAVAEIQATLMQLGLLAAHEDGFGEATDSAVRDFQQRRGVSVDGIVGPETYRALAAARWRLGDRLLTLASNPYVGDDVAALQERLLELGFDAGRVDGVFGVRTQQALRGFQREYGMVRRRRLRHGHPARAQAAGPPGDRRPAARACARASSSTGPAPRWPARPSSSTPATAGPTGARPARASRRPRSSRTSPPASRGAWPPSACGPCSPARRPPARRDAERAAFANEVGADLVVSLHVDRASSPRPQGVASYHFGTGSGVTSTVGEELASLVQREVTARTDLLDCSVHGKTWELLRLTRMPAVRLELGHLSHAGDAARLADPAFRDTVAEALLVAVQRLYLPADLDPPTGVLRLPDLSLLQA